MKAGLASPAAARAIVAGLALLLGACASTSLISSWQSPDYRGGPAKRLALFVMMQDESLRRFAENPMVQTTPGHTVENTTVVVETVLYTLPDDKPIWSATTQSLDPRSRSEMVQAISNIVDAELKKRGLVGTGEN